MTTKTETLVGHTPGPWVSGGIFVMKEGEFTIAEVDSMETTKGDRRKRAPSLETAYANASLIARAPEMAAEIEWLKEINEDLLEAAKLGERALEERNPEREEYAVKKLRAAITNAEWGK